MLRALLKRLLYFILLPWLRLFIRVRAPKSYAARAVVRYRDEILLVRNIGVKYWSLPGGKMESGETPEICLERELAEEVAVTKFTLDYKLGTYLSRHEGQRDLVHVYVVTAPSLYHHKQWEIDESMWFKLDELPENLSPATRRRLGEYKTGKRSLAGVW